MILRPRYWHLSQFEAIYRPLCMVSLPPHCLLIIVLAALWFSQFCTIGEHYKLEPHPIWLRLIRHIGLMFGCSYIFSFCSNDTRHLSIGI
ncbi:hypothetical protein C8J57DRAFT_1296098 [Mycena rebaudengoi]|nr:hypothetical protein C8J57DRAFT_1415130 [Mycena rebaudengoi]KAJ7205674.1 hypothetical protein C8J57DRAFT_1405431 [Mycena rebaudengoi]KAJ7218190.1 hypothetical protein C8J57DRAFT_1395289 [Mycena rebaudengoi]KAJ7246216.1 hypothetical protein C8J57DRAFT_1361025 [Mycena rebaudengoi]KAJ7281914.1 hypothetical protein C8J57DRAFT_1298871 [Mycena rebaudengoi]